MKVIPTRNSTLDVYGVLRVAISVVVGAFLLLCAAWMIIVVAEDSSSVGSFFSTYWITIVLVVLLIGMFAYKKVRAGKDEDDFAAARAGARSMRSDTNSMMTSGASAAEPVSFDEGGPSHQTVPILDKAPMADSEQRAYGACRIDQEVGKLVLGQPHRTDIMASRVLEDRRAIEASLIKALGSSDTDEDGRRRARQALEDYGFVARQSAMLLSGRDAWERSSAARTLGQIGSPSSLTFLIEALHDVDPVVRNQAVTSLGSLRLPAAIGALLDVARRHPDIPPSLLSETLSACSVDSFSYLDWLSSEPSLTGEGGGAGLELESFLRFEELPTGNGDSALGEVPAKLDNSD